MKHRFGLPSWSASVLVSLLGASCGGSPGEPGSNGLTFTASAQLQGRVGEIFSHSFCKPDLTGSAALCSGEATTPTGGQPPYHFQLGTGIGFPPVGLTLGLNGVLSGTPSIMGTNSFSVCAVDLAAKSVCKTVGMSVAGGIIANPASVTMTATSCYPSQCTVSRIITITSFTPWTSSVPGFGSLGAGFLVSPDVGPTGSTSVTISYTSSIPSPADGFIRFRTTTSGVYVEVPVIVNVN